MRRPAPRLIVITDLSLLTPHELVRQVEALAFAARAGSVAILLRDHDAPARLRLNLGRQLGQIARYADQQLWVADRLDLALLLEADGAHLGEASVSGHDARRLLGPDLHLSRAWHCAELEGLDAELDGLDALLLSPVFAARKGRPALGAPALASLGAALQTHFRPIRFYALGGVTAIDVPACDAAGAAGVAAIGAALVPEPRPLLEALGILRG
ncbi:MAG TPA: thiamine phosphate synthase [Polyangiaceae bacterium]|nr:thiamine phosphate synthase [Polyangiaceae bacterium]